MSVWTLVWPMAYYISWKDTEKKRTKWTWKAVGWYLFFFFWVRVGFCVLPFSFTFSKTKSLKKIVSDTIGNKGTECTRSISFSCFAGFLTLPFYLFLSRHEKQKKVKWQRAKKSQNQIFKSKSLKRYLNLKKAQSRKQEESL